MHISQRLFMHQSPTCFLISLPRLISTFSPLQLPLLKHWMYHLLLQKRFRSKEISSLLSLNFASNKICRNPSCLPLQLFNKPKPRPWTKPKPQCHFIYVFIKSHHHSTLLGGDFRLLIGKLFAPWVVFSLYYIRRLGLVGLDFARKGSFFLEQSRLVGFIVFLLARDLSNCSNRRVHPPLPFFQLVQLLFLWLLLGGRCFFW